MILIEYYRALSRTNSRFVWYIQYLMVGVEELEWFTAVEQIEDRGTTLLEAKRILECLCQFTIRQTYDWTWIILKRLVKSKQFIRFINIVPVWSKQAIFMMANLISNHDLKMNGCAVNTTLDDVHLQLAYKLTYAEFLGNVFLVDKIIEQVKVLAEVIVLHLDKEDIDSNQVIQRNLYNVTFIIYGKILTDEFAELVGDIHLG